MLEKFRVNVIYSSVACCFFKYNMNTMQKESEVNHFSRFILSILFESTD